MSNIEKTNRLDTLKKCPLFIGMDICSIESVLECLMATYKTYEKDEYIWHTDSIVSNIGIILFGSVNIIKEDFWGNRYIINKAAPGDMFGEAFSYSVTHKSSVSVVANKKCQILFINYKKIINTCPNTCNFHSQLINNMICILANKNTLLMQKMEHLSKRSTKEKLLSYLSGEAAKANSNIFDIPYNRQELADYLIADRSAMSNELCKLRDEGIINFHKNHFELLKKL